MIANRATAGHRLRIGCDVVALADVEYSIAQFGERYLRRVYTPAELRDCAGPDQVARLAARFAAKEAVIKALAEPSAAFGLNDVEVRRVRSMPTLLLSGAAARLAAEQGWVDSSLSLSHTTCHAAAAVAVTCADRGRADEEHLVVNGRVTREIAAGIAAELPAAPSEEH